MVLSQEQRSAARTAQRKAMEDRHSRFTRAAQQITLGGKLLLSALNGGGAARDEVIEAFGSDAEARKVIEDFFRKSRDQVAQADDVKRLINLIEDEWYHQDVLRALAERVDPDSLTADRMYKEVTIA